MSNSNTRRVFLQAVKAIVVSALKLVAIIIGWCCKSTGYILTKVGELTLKLAAK